METPCQGVEESTVPVSKESKNKKIVREDDAHPVKRKPGRPPRSSLHSPTKASSSNAHSRNSSRNTESENTAATSTPVQTGAVASAPADATEPKPAAAPETATENADYQLPTVAKWEFLDCTDYYNNKQNILSSYCSILKISYLEKKMPETRIICVLFKQCYGMNSGFTVRI